MPVQPPASARYCALSVSGGAWERSKLAAELISNLPTGDRSMAEYNRASKLALVVAQEINGQCATSDNRVSLLKPMLTAANNKYAEVDGASLIFGDRELQSLRDLRQRIENMIFRMK
ncbi:MAG: hypothetical protein ACK5PW_20005 [Burkholderiales bacterium]|jgi:hypothetical protein